MKKLISSLMICLTANAFGFSIVPDKIVTPLLDIYNKKNKDLGENVEVRVTTYDKSGELSRNGAKLVITKESYETFQAQASSVYRMQTREWRGTAFHIGHNLVLTNHHVLSKDHSNLTQCGDFKLLERSEDDYFDCKKVHFCEVKMDVCLIEMKPIKKGGIFRKKTLVYMADGPHLTLRARYAPTQEVQAKSVLTAIGNSKGLAMHLSQGLGLWKMPEQIYFYAPVTGGNSGGALLDEEGIVIGVVRAESVKKVDNDSSKVYNVAASSDHVIKQIREALQNDPETLEKFNTSVIE